MESFILSIAPFIWVTGIIVAFLMLCYFFLHEIWPGVIATFVAIIILVICWYTAATGFFVPVNQVALLVDNANGTVIGNKLPAGIQHRSILNTDYLLYPAATEQEWCADYTPSIQGGFEVKLTICVYYDASNTDWASIFSKTNKRSDGEVYAYWQNQLRSTVAETVKTLQRVDLTDNRATVQESLKKAMGTWFNELGIAVISVKLPNWDFTSDSVRQAFDDNATSQAGLLQAKANLEKAASERELQLFQADTQIQVLDALAKGQSAALDELKINSDQARAWFLIQREIVALMASRPDATIVVSVGSQSFSIPTTNQLPVTPVPGQ